MRLRTAIDLSCLIIPNVEYWIWFHEQTWTDYLAGLWSSAAQM